MLRPLRQVQQMRADRVAQMSPPAEAAETDPYAALNPLLSEFTTPQ